MDFLPPPTLLTFLGDLAPLSVDILLAAGIGLLLVWDILFVTADKRPIAIGAFVLSVVALACTWLLDINGTALTGAYVGDDLALFFKRIFLTAGSLAILSAIPYSNEHWPKRSAEYFELVLFSMLGMTLLAGVRDILLLVVAFELMGVPLYILAAYARRDGKSVEGALKLLLTGGVSSALVLFGVSILFGMSGTTELAGIATYAALEPSPLLLLGGTVAVAGMGFKIGVFPFHMWVPDTYEGSRPVVVTFMSVGPKAAGIVALIQILYAGDFTLLASVSTVLVALAAATMLVGNIAAIRQDNIKRLLGLSGVAHMGFMLMAMVAGTTGELGLATLLFYVLGYTFTNVGAFLVVSAVHSAGGDDSVDSFDGLVARSGFLSLAMLVFLLSLAGIPFVVGFWTKLYVFIAAWQAGMEILVVLGAVLSVLALFYYLRVARAMFMKPAPGDAPVFEPDTPTTLGIAVCLVFVIGMGLQPRPFIEAAENAATGYTAAKKLLPTIAALEEH